MTLTRNLLLLVVCFLPFRMLAQDCMGITLKAGSGYEMQSFSAKDKLNGILRYTIKNVRKEGGNTLVDIEFLSLDEKEKPRSAASQIKYTCTGNELIADLSGMALGSDQSKAFKDGEMRIKTNQLAYPRTLAEGQKLPDGKMEADVYTNGSLMMEMSILMSNRQVGAKESLTTPAGTFNVQKVSADLEMRNKVMGMAIPFNAKSVSYRADNVLFDIRSETYNKNGKLIGYTVLSKLF